MIPPWVANAAERSASSLLRGCFSFPEASAAQDVQHAEVPLVARVLIQEFVDRAQRHRPGPWPCVRRRVGDGGLIVDGFRVDAREAFDDFGFGGRTGKARL